MTRIFAFTLTFFLLITSCKKEEVCSPQNCIESSQNSNWISEDFKSQYSIQFPNTYEGTGMVGFEGNFFNKNRIDDQVKFAYSYCNPVYCFEFNDSLNICNTPSIQSEDINGNLVELDNKQEFCLNNEFIGVLYYNTISSATGAYFMNISGTFYEGLNIYFDFSEYQEVLDIVGTIKEE